MDWARAEGIGYAQLVTSVSAQSVLGHQLSGDLAGKLSVESPRHVDGSQFGMLKPLAPECQPIQTEITALQDALKMAAPGDKGNYTKEIKLRQKDLADCIKRHPGVVTTPVNPPVVTPPGKTPLNPICAQIDQQIKDYQAELKTASSARKGILGGLIKKKNAELAACKLAHPK